MLFMYRVRLQNDTFCFLDNRKPLRYESLSVRRIAHHTDLRFVGIYHMLNVKCVHTSIETCPHKNQYNSIGSTYEVPEIINESCVVGYAHEGYLPEQEAGSSQTYSLQSPVNKLNGVS
jgi:hypothetical protein